MVSRFQARVFLMIVLVALAATGATAWLTVRTTTAELTESREVTQRTADSIYNTLVRYGTDHATWEGVAGVVQRLGETTDQRIQVSTVEKDEVLADTDQMAGRTARQVSARPALVVDVRPELLTNGTLRAVSGLVTRPASIPPLTESAVAQMASYREGARFAICLTRQGVPVHRKTAAGGRIYFVQDVRADPGVVKGCSLDSRSSPAEFRADGMAVKSCPRDKVAVQACLRRAFTLRVREFTPVELQLNLGFKSQRMQQPEVSFRRTVLAAGVVALLAIIGTVLLSRRVLSSLAALGQASRRLADGNLSERVPVRGDDEVAALARSFNRMAEALQRSEEQQRRMISDIAHELRTPLANIRGYLEAVQDGLLAPDPELFASLHEEAVLQQRLIDDLQELALAEAGSLVYHRSLLDPGELVVTCLNAHRAVAEAAGVRLAADPGDPAGPPAVHADPDRLRQVIGNLITNAVRAAEPDGTVTLRVHADRGDAVITVTDDGSGISPEDLDHVFDRFWRADGARSRITGGRGLGLAISREIVHAHGGELSAVSTLGAGSAFTVRVPVAQ
ncbi:MAG: ATP-binding protein [Streptosporangiaceae bacterium]